MTRSVHRKQRALTSSPALKGRGFSRFWIKPASTPQTPADMAKYYEMLKGAKNDKQNKTNTDAVGKTTRREIPR